MASIIVIVVGFGVVVATTIVSVVRRSTLRTEAQQAASVVGTSTESDTPDRVLAG